MPEPVVRSVSALSLVHTVRDKGEDLQAFGNIIPAPKLECMILIAALLVRLAFEEGWMAAVKAVILILEPDKNDTGIAAAGQGIDCWPSSRKHHRHLRAP